jgi:hypothetical protein
MHNRDVTFHKDMLNPQCIHVLGGAWLQTVILRIFQTDSDMSVTLNASFFGQLFVLHVTVDGHALQARS